MLKKITKWETEDGEVFDTQEEAEDYLFEQEKEATTHHTDTELTPCPFCGGKAYFEIDDDRWQWVECGSCGMQGNRSASLMEDCKPKLSEAWNRRAPSVPVPQFSRIAQKKLDYLLEAGEAITGYAIENKDGRRGAIDCHGFVYWWQDAAVPVPQGLFDAIEHGDETHRGWLKSALEAFFSGKPIPQEVSTAKHPPEAAPVPQGWKLVPVELLDRATESLGSFVSDHGWGQADMDTFDDLSALASVPQPPEAAPMKEEIT